jgi:ABC-type multidrug transport system ATPase subunit
MTPSSEVQLVALTKLFGRTVAVDAISAEIPAGSYCCLLGPSGCGKTTTPHTARPLWEKDLKVSSTRRSLKT